jgi:hypothetical protein
MIKLTQLNEASEVKFKELKPIQQKQVVAFQKVIGADHSQIFAGIHGMVVDIPADGNFGSGYRFGADTLKWCNCKSNCTQSGLRFGKA